MTARRLSKHLTYPSTLLPIPKRALVGCISMYSSLKDVGILPDHVAGVQYICGLRRQKKIGITLRSSDVAIEHR